MDLQSFVMWLIATGIIVALVSLVATWFGLFKREALYRGLFSAGDIVELANGDMATVTKVNRHGIIIRVEGIEHIPLSLSPLGLCETWPNFNVSKIVGHADFIV